VVSLQGSFGWFSCAAGTPMRTFFKEGERVTVEFGVGDPQLGKIIATSQNSNVMTVRLSNGIMGQGDMPLQWRHDDEYDLLAGGRVKIRKLA
jgi:hypothetical protein